MNAPQRPALGRPIVSLADAQRELLAKGLQIAQAIRFIGLYTLIQANRLSPQSGDCWIEIDESTGNASLLLQLSERPRLRFVVVGVLENA